MRSFVKIKSSQMGKITLSFTNIGKPLSCHEFLTSKIGVLMLFAKIKFSRKFPNLQYLGQLLHFDTYHSCINSSFKHACTAVFLHLCPYYV